MKKKFIIVELIIYLTFIIFDLLKMDSTYIKYLGIIFCFLYSLLNAKKFQSISMFFTLIADMFLLVLNRYYEIGVLSFIVVQIIYILFIKNNNKKYFVSFLIFRFVVLFLGTLILCLTKNLNLLNFLVITYFSNLLINTIESYTIKNNILSLGLTLFVCCDICVGLHNVLPHETIASFLMWVFYLPSQVLIVLA